MQRKINIGHCRIAGQSRTIKFRLENADHSDWNTIDHDRSLKRLRLPTKAGLPKMRANDRNWRRADLVIGRLNQSAAEWHCTQSSKEIAGHILSGRNRRL